MLLVFDRSGFMTLATGDMKRTKRSGPRTEPWGTPVHNVVLGEDNESIFNKGCAVSQIGPVYYNIDRAGLTTRLTRVQPRALDF